MKNCYSILLTLFLVFSLNAKTTAYYNAESKKDWKNPVPWTTTNNGVEDIYAMLFKHNNAVKNKTLFTPTIDEVKTSTDGCKNGGRIEVKVSGTTGPVLYQLAGPTPFPQGVSNIFDGLTSGEYTVMVYDGSTGGTPVTQKVKIENNFTDLSIDSVIQSNNLSASFVCAPRGIITVKASGGKEPLLYSLINKVTNTVVTGMGSQPLNVFTGVPTGIYSVLVTDACGNIATSGGGGITVSDYDDISTAKTLVPNLIGGIWPTNNVLFKEAADCKSMSVSFDPGKTFWSFTIKDASNKTLKINNKDIEYQVGTPDGKWSDWVASDMLASVAYTLPNNNDVNFTFNFRSACNHSVTASATYTYKGFNSIIPSAFNSFKSNCTPDPITGFKVNVSNGSDWLACFPVNINIVDQTAGNVLLGNKNFDEVSISGYSMGYPLTTPGSYNGYIPGHTVLVTMKDYNNLTITQEYTIPEPVYNQYRMNGNIGAWHPETGDCAFTGTKYEFVASSNLTTAINTGPFPVTFTVIGGLNPLLNQSVTVRSNTETNPDGSLKINAPFGTYLPWGTYDFQIEFGGEPGFGCRTITIKDYNNNQRVKGLYLGNTTAIANVTGCKTYAVTVPYYYTDMNGIPMPASTIAADGVWITLTNTDGTGNGNQSVYAYNRTSYSFTGVPAGIYKITIAPYDNKGAAPTCFSDSKNITLAPYALPVIDVPHSGGLVCAPATKGNLTVAIVAGTGTSLPLQYAYKKQGAADATYSSLQTNNIFPLLDIGNYTVKVVDGCGYTITQDLTVASSEASIFSGKTQTICPGTTATVTTTPIGMVTNYKWTAPDGVTVLQNGPEFYQLVIPNFTAANNSDYTVIATSPAGCTAKGTITLTAATDLNLIVTNPAAVCAGTSVNLANAVSGVASYIYYGNDQTTVLATPTVTPLLTTDYYVQGTSASGCVLPKQKITVTVNPAPALVVTNPAPVATAGTTVNLTAAAITAGSTNVATLDYFEDLGCTIPVANPSIVTITGNKTYYIKASSVGGCTDIKPVTITTLFPSVAITGTDGTCASDCTVTAATSWTVDPLVAQYKLTNTVTGVSVGPITGSTANIFNNLVPGTYTVTVYDATTGAAGLTSAPITVTSPYKQLKLTAITVSSGTGCSDAGTITYGTEDGKQPVNYWIVNSAGTTTASETNSLGTVTFTGVAPGTYIAHAKDACGTEVWENDVIVTGVDLSDLGSVKLRNAPKYFDQGVDCNHLNLSIDHITDEIELYKADGVTPITIDRSILTYQLEYTTGTPAVTTISNILPGQTSLEVPYSPFTPTKYRVIVKNPCTSVDVASDWVTIDDPSITVSTFGTHIKNMCETGGLALSVYYNTKPCFPITDITVTDVNDASKVWTFPNWTDPNQTDYPLTTVPPIPAGTYHITAKDGNGHPYTIVDTYTGTDYEYTPATQDAKIRVEQGCDLGKVNLSVTGILSSTTSPSSFPIVYTITSGPAGTVGTKFTQEISTGVDDVNTIFNNLPSGAYTITVDYASDGTTTPCRTQTISLDAVSPIVSYNIDKLWYTGCGAAGSTHTLFGSITGVDADGNVFHGYQYGGGSGMIDNIYATAWAEIISGPPAYTGPTGEDSAVKTPNGETEFKFTNLPAGTYKIGVYPEYFRYHRECLSPNYPIEKTITIVDGGTLALDKTNSGGVVCSGTTGTLIVNAIGAGPFTYQYKKKGDPATSYSAEQTSNEFTGLAAGEYDVKIKGACISIEETLTMLNTSAASLLTITPSPAVCEGKEAVIKVAPIGPINSIVWTLNGTPFTSGLDAEATTLTIPSFASANAGTYKITVTSGAGCTFTSELAVTLDTPPVTPTITTMGTVPTCIGGTATMAATPAGGKWSSSDPTVLSIDSITGFATALTAGNANIIYTASSVSGGCTATATLPVVVTECTVTPKFTVVKTVSDANGDKKAQANEELTYTITVKNTGSATINSLTVSDAVPANTTYVSGGTLSAGKVSFTASDLGVGASTSFTFKVKTASDLTGVNVVSNLATVGGDGTDVPSTPEDPNNPGNPDPACTDPNGCPTDIPTDSAPKFTVVKTVSDANGDKKAQANEELTYTITVKNTGSATINSLTVSDAVPANTTYVSGGTLSAGKVSFTDTNLGVGASRSYSFVVKVATDLTNVDKISNLATVKGDGGKDVPSAPEDPNNPGNPDPSCTGGCSTDIPTHAVSSIAVIKKAVFVDENNNGYAEVGETIRYSFEVKNTGNETLTNVTITDNLPGLVLSGSPITLAPGEINSTNFVGVYAITKADIDAGSVTNQALAEGTTPSGEKVNALSDNTNFVDDKPTVIDVVTCVVEVFNAVSPNGDGLNDEFRIQGLECYPNNTVEIYNRWGVKVFETSGYGSNGNTFKGYSDGRATISRGESLPDGTYFYILKYFDEVRHKMLDKSGYLYIKK